MPPQSSPAAPSRVGSSVLAELVDKVAAQMQAGEKVDVEALARQCPEHADELRRLLPALGALADLSRSRSACPLPGGEEHRGVLGDFRIVREVGRGGMGVVYEAEQISLRRRVALKVLPYAAVMDPRALQRFQNEARAAACLHHPNIVPVHAIGHERGMHFYAMQFIDGQSLAELIASQRQSANGAAPPARPDGRTAANVATAPAAAGSTDQAPRDAGYFRRVAEWGIQAAEALEYAHSLGIVHRDVKPGNLMLDERGTLWVADFGLARTAADSGLTMTGDLLGTLRYMSPEQALAKHGLVDHRTDVYSLGATLYELLTGTPAISGSDRQEVLNKVTNEEPTALRRLDSSIPADLETIVQVAMNKEPSERYQSARALADDLRCFLQDRSIQARRPGLLALAARWARRHQAAVLAAAAVLLLTALVAGGAGLWWLQKRSAAEGEARAELQEAARLQRQERWEEAQGAVRRAQGALAGFWVDPALEREVEGRARDLDMVQRLEEARLRSSLLKEGKPDHAGCIEAYAEAFDWYGLDVRRLGTDEAGERIRESSVCLKLALALDYWAALLAGVPETRAERRRLAAAASAADPDPWRCRLRAACQEDQPRGLDALAASARGEDMPPLSAALLSAFTRHTLAAGRVLEVLRQVRRRHPDDFFVNLELGDGLRRATPPQPDEALRCFQATVALRPRSALARIVLAQGLRQKGRPEEAEAECRVSIELGGGVRAYNELGIALSDLARFDQAAAAFRAAIMLGPGDLTARINLGMALRKGNKPRKAAAAFREALRLSPGDPVAHNQLGLALASLGDFDSALKEFLTAAEAREGYAEAHCNAGIALYRLGQFDRAIKAYEKALAEDGGYAPAHFNLGLALAASNPDQAIEAYNRAIELKPDYAEAHNNLGFVRAGRRQWDMAIESFRKAIRSRKGYALAHENLGNALRQKGRPEQAIVEYEEATRIDSNRPDAQLALGCLLSDQGRHEGAVMAFRAAIRLRPNDPMFHYHLGLSLASLRRWDMAKKAYEDAIRLRWDFAEAHCNLGHALQELGRFREAMKARREGHKLGYRRDGWRYPSARWLREAEVLAGLAERLPDVLAGRDRPKDAEERVQFAALCRKYHQRHAAAARLYGEAFDERPALADELQHGHRYGAACSAAQAGCRHGKDAAKLTDEARAALRKRALAWLRDDLRAFRRLLTNGPAQPLPVIAGRLKDWQEDAAFAGVRGGGLGRLPEAEQPGWRKLWADVATTLAEAQAKGAPASKGRAKQTGE